MKCNNCDKEAIHQDSDQALCRECMEKEDLIWHPDWHSFQPRRRTCDCGAIEEWCSACETYSCTGCSDYGTCMCS